MEYLASSKYTYETEFGVTKQDMLMALAAKLGNKRLPSNKVHQLFKDMVATLGLHPVVASSFCQIVFNIVPDETYKCHAVHGLSYFSQSAFEGNNKAMSASLTKVLNSASGSKFSKVVGGL